MRYNVISYLIGEGFRNVLKNKKSTIVSITTMCLTMLMFGVFFILGENINHIVTNIEQQQGMQVYIDKEATSEEVSNVEQEIRKIDGVNTIEYLSKEESLRRAKEQLKNNDTIEKFMAGMSEEQFEDSYTITLTDLALNESVQQQIMKIDKVSEIVATDQTINTLESIAQGLRIGILVLLIALMIISIFIISNTIKLSVHARRKEISIMKYVGATNGFIRTPFMIEGIIIGLISGIISILVVGGGYNYIANALSGSETWQKLSINLLSFGDMIGQIVLVYILLGVGIGIVGSSISMKKYLEV